MEPINSEQPLAKAFNRIISDLELLRIMTNPRIFSDSTDKEAPFRMHNYYLTILWERWLHGVFNRLVEWANTISSYFDEYNGSWEYYALSQRLEFIKEYGSDDEDDYNPDDTIKTTGIIHVNLTFLQDLLQPRILPLQFLNPRKSLLILFMKLLKCHN